MNMDAPFDYRTQANGKQIRLTVKGQDQEGTPAALTTECIAEISTDGKVKTLDGKGNTSATANTSNGSLSISDATEATIIVSAATNFVNYHDVSGNASLRNAVFL